MEAGLKLAGALVACYCGGILSTVLWPNWLQRRRRDAVGRPLEVGAASSPRRATARQAAVARSGSHLPSVFPPFGVRSALDA